MQSNHDVLIFCNRNVTEVTIPNFIKCIATGAFDHCRHLTKITIPDDSEVQKIEQLAFSDAGIESLRIPSSLIDLEDDWCERLSNLNRVDVDQNNPKYANFGKMVIGKSSLESNFDTLIFCCRDANEVTIPSYIKYINEAAFGICKKLQNVDILIYQVLDLF